MQISDEPEQKAAERIAVLIGPVSHGSVEQATAGFPQRGEGVQALSGEARRAHAAVGRAVRTFQQTDRLQLGHLAADCRVIPAKLSGQLDHSCLARCPKAYQQRHEGGIERQPRLRHKVPVTLVSGDFKSILGSHAPVSFAAWQDRVKGMYDAFSGGRHALDFYAVEGRRVVTVGRFQGVHTGTFMARPATGRAVSAAVMHVDRVEDGKIIEHVAQLDILGLLGQLDARL